MTDQMTPLPFSRPVETERLSRAETLPVAVSLEPEERARLVGFLGVEAVEDLSLEGEIGAWAERGWRFSGRLRARVEQACVVTLEPVLTAVDERLERRFLPADEGVAGPEILRPDLEDGEEDAVPEPFDGRIELAAIVIEALTLALDPYPRAEGAELGRHLAGPPGAEPLTDEAMRPFARLAALRDKLGGGGDAG